MGDPAACRVSNRWEQLHFTAATIAARTTECSATALHRCALTLHCFLNTHVAAWSTSLLRAPWPLCLIGVLYFTYAAPATWVLFVAHATYNFVRYTIEQEMPKFFSDVRNETVECHHCVQACSVIPSSVDRPACDSLNCLDAVPCRLIC